MQRGTQEGARRPATERSASTRGTPESLKRVSFSSNPQSPKSPSSSIHPSLHPSVTNVPVTPGVHWDGRSAYIQGRDSPEDERFTSRPTTASPVFGTKWGEDLSKDTKGAQAVDNREGSRRPEGPLVKDDVVNRDPRERYPELNLSGRVISATFTIPYSLGFVPDSDWEISSRRGNSALFESLAYFAGRDSSWNHTLVGWTGEMKELPRRSASRPGTASSIVNSVSVHPLNRASAPIPVDGQTKIQDPSEMEGMYIGKADRDKLEVQLGQSHGGRILPVWLADEIKTKDDVYVITDQSRWRRFAESELYRLFHYQQNEPTDGRVARKAWADYYRMNQAFADRIIETYRPGDLVIIHDFHLLLLPSLLRQRLPHVFIGFFLHVPFPSSEYYRCLSRRKEILEGVLGANMIGFQSYSYSRHFSSCCTRILGFDSSSSGVDAYGAHVAVDVFPIGINAAAIENTAFASSRIDDKVAKIREKYAGKKIIVGRDRLDAVRGVAQKLQAFQLFLEKYPEWIEQVVLIQITSPSHTHSLSKANDDNNDTRFVNKISDLVADINGEFGSLSFAPVQHFPQYLSQEEYFALLRAADVGLITSVRDGMNTTSLEYVICQRDSHGPLILSEFSGTAGSLDSALHVNPWDLGGVADTIHEALIMPADKRRTLQDRLYNHVVVNNIQSWTNNYLKKLLSNLSSFDQSFATPALDRASMLKQYRKAKKRLFMFDYDGTLTPIVRDPSAAIPSDRVIRTLKTLASDPANAVWIISGRDQAFLDEWMGHIAELGLSAEHGSFIRHPKSDVWINLTETMDMSWQQEVVDVFQQYTEKTQGSFVERKKIALTWHYRRADPEYGAMMARAAQRQLEDTVVKRYDVEVMTGKANIEVRPRFVNKGEITRRLVHEANNPFPPSPAPTPTTTVTTTSVDPKAQDTAAPNVPLDFVFCTGDDFTDEDMFAALRATDNGLERGHVFTVTVGASSKQTLADWHVVDPSDVISVVGLLNGSAGAEDAGAVAVVEGTVSDSRL